MASGSPDSLLECDVILCFCDCLHSIPNDCMYNLSLMFSTIEYKSKYLGTVTELCNLIKTSVYLLTIGYDYELAIII